MLTGLSRDFYGNAEYVNLHGADFSHFYSILIAKIVLILLLTVFAYRLI